MLGKAQDGTDMYDAIPIGSFSSCGGTPFSDSRNNEYYNGIYYSDNFNYSTAPPTYSNSQPSQDVWYTFTVSDYANITFSLCGSSFDTYIHVLDENGNIVDGNDDSDVCGGLSSYLGINWLSTGTYYLVVEGYDYDVGNYNLEVSSQASSTVPLGANLTKFINAGTFNGSATYSNTLSNADPCLGNNYGQISNDIYYKFTLSSAATVKLSHCGSGFDTYMWLLDSNGGYVTHNDDNYALGAPCPGTQSYIETALAAGTYYLISEGYGNNTGTIVTNIQVDMTGPVTISYPSTSHTFITGVASVPLVPTVSNIPNFDWQVTSTYAGSGSQGFANGATATATFNWPLAVAMDGTGNLYVTDSRNQAIRKISPAGVVSTFAGSGYAGYVNGTGTGASFRNPAGLAIDAYGNVYVADQQNHAIRKITPGGVVTTVAGNGTAGFTNGSGTSARFNLPADICIDASGNLYIGDSNNNRIRKITTSGIVSTYAGSGAVGSSNGAAASASFKDPRGLLFDTSGNLIVCDRQNYLIRKITPSGIVSTLAGSGITGWIDGSSTSARFGGANSASIDASGNLYVVDQGGNHMIRKIATNGTVSTYAGTTTTGNTDGGGPVVRFNTPYGIGSGQNGVLYVADTYNNKIRKISTQPFSISPTLPPGLVFNTSNGTISGTPTAISTATVYTIIGYNVSTSLTITVTNNCLSVTPGNNYVVTYMPKEANMTTGVSVISNSCDPYKVQTNIQYFDGLGRPSQTISVKGNNDATKDVVQPIVYDLYGRESRKYLPYASITANGSYKTDALTAQASFYSVGNPTPPVGVVRTAFPFSQTVFEMSPLNRVEQQGAPGDAWQTAGMPNATDAGHTLKVKYLVNNIDVSYATTGFAVRLYSSTPSTVIGEEYKRILSGTGYYATGQLYLTITKDENWSTLDAKAGTMEEYRDKTGKVVLKRTFNYKNSAIETLSTYYVYDDFGNLCFVLPPGANPDGTTLLDQAALDNFCYQYRYDTGRRLIENRIPAKGWEYMIYNNIDQIILTQDANQRVTNQWIYSKFDALERLVMTGIYTNTTVLYRPSMQLLVDNESNLMVYNPIKPSYEKRMSTGQGYSDDSFPRNTASYLTINYFDNYDFPGNTFGSQNSVQSNMTQDRLTGSKINVLGSNTMLLTVIYYDKYGRAVQSKGQNHLLNGTDVVDNTYSFTGELETSVRNHTAYNSTTTIATSYEYDHMGRKRQTTESINNASPVILSRQTYNHIGQLLEKKVHSTDNGTSFLNTTSYAYNERGWVTGIANDNAGFTETLRYNNPEVGTIAQYNGNIVNQLYSNGTSNVFKYSYDKLNRLTGSTASGLGEQISYDVMGNLTQMVREGHGTNNYTAYTGNQLTTISGFTNGSYTYDANGNMKTGPGGLSLDYNYLNLPVSTTKSGIPFLSSTYVYDANGKRLKMQSSLDGMRDYADDVEYLGNTIYSILTDEGRALAAGGGNYNYQYNLSDHLGNVRASIWRNPNSQSLEVVQRDDYYSFGLRKPISSVFPDNKYLYNGKELQKGLEQYDYGARFYDPVIGRWNVVDELSEWYYDNTPYAYVLNNPPNGIDPDGRYSWFGATWRSVLNGGQNVHKSGSEWGYNGTNANGSVFIFGDSGKSKPQAVLSAYKPDMADRWRDGNFAQQFLYTTADGITSNFQDHHLGGAGFENYNDKITTRLGGIATVASGVIGSGVKSVMTAETVAAKGGGSWAKSSGILRDALKGKGNHDLGSGTAEEAMQAGKAWVGEGFEMSKNGRFMISKDGLRQFQPANFKPKLGIEQANFYWKNLGKKSWQSNGHLGIIKP